MFSAWKRTVNLGIPQKTFNGGNELYCRYTKENKSILFHEELDTFIQKIYISECFLHTLQMHFKCGSVSIILYALKTDQGENGNWASLK